MLWIFYHETQYIVRLCVWSVLGPGRSFPGSPVEDPTEPVSTCCTSPSCCWISGKFHGSSQVRPCAVSLPLKLKAVQMVLPFVFMIIHCVPNSTVQACLDLLLSWIHRYIDEQDSSDKQVCCDVSLHGPFYTACQAVFYTLIFRHRALLQSSMRKGIMLIFVF